MVPRAALVETGRDASEARRRALILCVASKSDVASRRIAEELIDGYAFERLPRLFRGSPMYLKVLDGKEVKLIMVELASYVEAMCGEDVGEGSDVHLGLEGN